MAIEVIAKDMNSKVQVRLTRVNADGKERVSLQQFAESLDEPFCLTRGEWLPIMGIDYTHVEAIRGFISKHCQSRGALDKIWVSAGEEERVKELNFLGYVVLLHAKRGGDKGTPVYFSKGSKVPEHYMNQWINPEVIYRVDKVEARQLK